MANSDPGRSSITQASSSGAVVIAVHLADSQLIPGMAGFKMFFISWPVG